MKLKSLSMFFPAYNDEHTIGHLVRDALTVAKEIALDYEVVVIDDGSEDRTSQLLDELAKGHDEVRVIHHSENKGYGVALRSGFKAAQKEWIFYTDGDAQYDVKELLKLVPFTDRADVINGYKRKRADFFLRRIVGRLYHQFCRFLFNIKIRDIDCDFRLIKGAFIKRVDLISNGGAICVEIIKKLQNLGARFYEVPVPHYPRPYGRSQFFAGVHIFVMLKEVIKLWIKMMVLRKRQYR